MEPAGPQGSRVRGTRENVMWSRQLSSIRLLLDSSRDCENSCAAGGVCPMNLFSVPRAPRDFRKTGRVLGTLVLAAAIPISAITASAAGPIASSSFAGVEDPLSEGGTWVPLTSLWPYTAQLQKSDGAFPEAAGHAGAHTTAAVPADQYSEIVVGYVGGPADNVGPTVRVQTSGPSVDSHYLWW